MSRKYLGRLPKSDPLHEYLENDVQPQISGGYRPAEYSVFKLFGSNDVYLYEDRHSGIRIIGKFFTSARQPDWGRAAQWMEREFQNLCQMRDLGLTASPHYVARPLGRNHPLNNLLAIEYCDGELLSDVITKAIEENDPGRLLGKLTALAYFLATLHRRTANGHGVDFDQECGYLDRLVETLLGMGALTWEEALELSRARDGWRGQPGMWDDRQVLVHGDATPANFLFGDGLDVMTFDLERVKRTDRVFDLGRIAGELKHFLLRATGDRQAAEPFIGHFLREYSWHFPDPDGAFEAIARRVSFYMGTTLLRVSRNNWISPRYRRTLIDEAKACLWGFR